jgi:hypothetical protein
MILSLWGKNVNHRTASFRKISGNLKGITLKDYINQEGSAKICEDITLQ